MSVPKKGVVVPLLTGDSLQNINHIIRVIIVPFSDVVYVCNPGMLSFVFRSFFTWCDSELKVVEGKVTDCSESDLLKRGKDAVKKKEVLLKPLKEARDEISKAVFNLTTRGGTAIGSAMLVAIGILTKLKGGEMIVCTDGESTTGISLHSSYFIRLTLLRCRK